MTDISLDPMSPDDLGTVRGLLDELGYDIDPETLAARLGEVLAREDHLTLIAKIENAPAGLVHAFVRAALEKPVTAYVQSLVVRETARRQGVAAALTDAVEAWARDLGLSSVALHSNVVRDDALSFYTARGFEQVAEARLLRKAL